MLEIPYLHRCLFPGKYRVSFIPRTGRCALPCRESYNRSGRVAVRALVRDDLDYMPPRILIADDNAIFRKALRQLLESADHWEILEAKSGEEAVEKSVEARPNLIILDLAMPGKDGFAAARDISASLPSTPILMCTMHMSPLVEAEALKSGIRKVLSKADSSLLVPAIRQLLNPEPPSDRSAASNIIPPPVVAPNPALTAPLSPTTPSEAASEPAPPAAPKNVA